MTVQLVPLNAGSVPAVPIARPVILIGRHPECDFRIDSSQISRRHCCIAMAYDRVLIRDLGSRNGVLVNGVVVDEARLNHGDEVAIGHLLYRFENPLVKPGPPKRSKPAPSPALVEELIIDLDLDDDLPPLD